jgi:hypothetical protein
MSRNMIDMPGSAHQENETASLMKHKTPTQAATMENSKTDTRTETRTPSQDMMRKELQRNADRNYHKIKIKDEEKKEPHPHRPGLTYQNATE